MDSTGGSFLEPLHSQLPEGVGGSFALGNKKGRGWWGATAESVIDKLGVPEEDRENIRAYRREFHTIELKEAIRKMALQFRLNHCALSSAFAVIAFYKHQRGAPPLEMIHAAAVHLETLTPPSPSMRLNQQWREGEVAAIEARMRDIAR